MTSQTRSLAATILAGAAVLAALWLLAIAPKRTERAEVGQNVGVQQARLDRAQAPLTTYSASRAQFPRLLAKLRRLDKAVPSRAAVASMLRELQRRARVRGSDLRLVALKDAVGTATAAPGAIAGPGGLSALSFTFEYTGRYFDLVDILATVRRSVRLKGGVPKVDGRLLTIDGLSFKRLDDKTSLTKAVVNASAYIAPDGSASPQPPAQSRPPTAKTEGP